MREYPVCTIVSVDYALRQVYPRPLQDVLDAYYWLTSGSEQVQQVLGFQPNKVVVAGDSAGAYLVYTLCLILTDMKEYSTKQQLGTTAPLPHAIVSIYGFYTLSHPSPVMALSFLDLFMTPSVIRVGFGALINGCDEPSWNSKLFSSSIGFLFG